MRLIEKVILPMLLIFGLTSCDLLHMEATNTRAVEIYDELWNEVNKKYVCFSAKDVNWDEVYNKYHKLINDNTTPTQLFSILSNMLGELNDGHMALMAGAENWVGKIPYDSVNEVSQQVIFRYLGENCRNSGGLRYNTIRNGAIGYIRYRSFDDNISPEQLNEVIEYCDNCKGVIIDIRGNSGGLSTNMMTILNSMPCNDELYKTFARYSSDHNDFIQTGTMYKPELDVNNAIWRRPLCILIDHNSYSASSVFSMCVKGAENVLLIGTETGGGTNIPLQYEMSNGWIYKIPSVKLLSRDKIDYENGIEPDINIKLEKEILKDGIDNVIEKACDILIQRDNIKLTNTHTK